MSLKIKKKKRKLNLIIKKFSVPVKHVICGTFQIFNMGESVQVSRDITRNK